jgi:hypothetical protein
MPISVTTTEVRDLLNRPRGLNENTISEYITVRTHEVNKVARDGYYVATTSAEVGDDLKNNAVKMLVCVDCLIVLIDTVPTFWPEKEAGVHDRRFQHQLQQFRERADRALKEVSEAVGSAYAEYKSTTRIVP